MKAPREVRNRATSTTHDSMTSVLVGGVVFILPQDLTSPNGFSPGGWCGVYLTSRSYLTQWLQSWWVVWCLSYLRSYLTQWLQSWWVVWCLSYLKILPHPMASVLVGGVVFILPHDLTSPNDFSPGRWCGVYLTSRSYLTQWLQSWWVVWCLSYLKSSQ